jgi:hypothetical protein
MFNKLKTATLAVVTAATLLGSGQASAFTFPSEPSFANIAIGSCFGDASHSFDEPSNNISAITDMDLT